MRESTPRRRVLLALAHAEEPQTVRQLCASLERTPGSVQTHLENLARLGLIRHVSGWELTESGKAATGEGVAYFQPRAR